MRNLGTFQPGHTPWNKGNRATTTRSCKICFKSFEVKTSEAQRGHGVVCSKTCRAKNSEEDNPSGNYSAIHKWVSRRLGTPSKCDSCGSVGRKKYEWSNKSGRYLPEFSDWQRLCVPCHRRFDGHSYKAWATRRKNPSPARLCQTNDCMSRHYALGTCSKHYQRLRNVRVTL